MAHAFNATLGKSRFRPMPALGQQKSIPPGSSDQERIDECARSKGHVLKVCEREITCTLCPAVWKDEGF